MSELSAIKVCVWYITAGEEEYLNPSVEFMQAHDWVGNIVILHTNPTLAKGQIYNLVKQFPKVKEYMGRNYGTGWEKSVNFGGFDEIEARNDAIRIAEQTDCQWLLQCDSDEIFTYETIESIEKAAAKDCKSVIYSCFHFKTPTGYVTNNTDRHIKQDKQVFDPHCRAWKKYIKARYSENPNSGFLAQYPNKSVHCVHSGERSPYVAEEMY